MISQALLPRNGLVTCFICHPPHYNSKSLQGRKEEDDTGTFEAQPYGFGRVTYIPMWLGRKGVGRRSNQSVLKEVSPEYSLKGLMLKLKLQYFGHLIWRAESSEETLMLGKIEGRMRRWATEDEMVGWHHWLNGHEFEQTLAERGGQGSLATAGHGGHRESDMTEQLNWKATNAWSQFSES